MVAKFLSLLDRGLKVSETAHETESQSPALVGIFSPFSCTFWDM